MLNPANAKYALVGVYDPAISPLMAASLQRLGISKALVVHSMGLDELTPLGDADVVEVRRLVCAPLKMAMLLLYACETELLTIAAPLPRPAARHSGPSPHAIRTSLACLCYETILITTHHIRSLI